MLFWVMVFAVTLNSFATPLGGECLEEDGRLCCVAAEFLCPRPNSDGESAPSVTREVQRTTAPDVCGAGHCHWLSQDSATYSVSAHTIAATQETLAILPPAVAVHTATLVTTVPTYRANAPPGLHSLRLSRRSPRAPPFCA